MDDTQGLSWFDRLFPRRVERREKLRRIEDGLERWGKTINGIKSDHGLDDLLLDIELARDQGVEAMGRLKAAREAACDESEEERRPATATEHRPG